MITKELGRKLEKKVEDELKREKRKEKVSDYRQSNKIVLISKK